MKKSMNIASFILICIFSLPIVVVAQDDINTEGLTRVQILKQPLISTAFSIATVTGVGFIDSVDFENMEVPWWLSATAVPMHLPMYQIDKGLGRRYSIAEAGFLASYYATKSSPTFAELPYNLYLKTAWYSTYDVYKIARSKAKPGIYTDEWRGYGVKELSLAPFQLKNILRPVFYIPVGLILWSQVNSIIESDSSIFKTRKAYIDGKKVPMGLAVPGMTSLYAINFLATAIGEEALYRGVIYEELKVSYGARWAKLIDFFLFPAIHVPMDMAAGRDSEEIFGRFIERGIATLLFDYAYDKGGLPLSVSLHTWFNFINFTTRWMAEGGKPESSSEENGSAASVMPPLVISYTIKF